jgi:ParB family transcriptional regulator, chromosome partitioning protein
MRLGGLQ